MNESDPPDRPPQGSYRPPVPGRINLRTGADNSQFPPLPPPPPAEERVWVPPLTIGVLAVRGNQEASDVRMRLPVQRIVAVGPWRIGMVHGDGGMGRTTAERARRSFSAVACIIFGHSHQPINEEVEGVLLFNPGSPTDRRKEPSFSYGLLQVTDAGIMGEIVRFQRG